MSDQITKQADEKFCESCGGIIKQAAEICPKCGVRQKPAGRSVTDGPGKEWTTTLVLCIFLGCIGVHRFYTGHTGIGILQLLTLGCCGIFTFVDFISIITGSYTDKQGNPLVKK